MEKSNVNETDSGVLMLNENGLIMNCDSVAGKLFGCLNSQILWQPVSRFLPQLAENLLMKNGVINPRLRFLSRVDFLFDVASSAGEHFQCRLFFNELENSGRKILRLIIRPEKPMMQPC